METLFTITFNKIEEALDVFNKIKTHSEKEDLELISGILISKTEEGGLIIRESYNMGPEGTLSGSIVGALVNVLGGLPDQYNFHASNSIFRSIPNTDKLDLSAYLAKRVDNLIEKNTSAIIADIVESGSHEFMDKILSKYKVKVKKEDLLNAMEEQFLEHMSFLDKEIEGLSHTVDRTEDKGIGEKIDSIEEKKEKLMNKLIKKVDNRKQAYRKSISNLELKDAKRSQQLLSKDVQRVEAKIKELNKKEEELVKKLSSIK